MLLLLRVIERLLWGGGNNFKGKILMKKCYKILQELSFYTPDNLARIEMFKRVPC